MSQILCLWSGPRNISTAMMRSFGARPDTTCWDEPFFAAYLDQTGLPHPGREETLAGCEIDPARVVERILAPVETAYYFQKHMAHHMIAGMPTQWMEQARHVLLIRHPARVITSYAKGRPDFVGDDLGFSRLVQLHAEITEMQGKAPLIVDCDDILTDPDGQLRHICEDGFGIPYDPTMLSWEAGPRPEDGPWAPYWYDNVIASTKFAEAPGALPKVSAAYAEIYETARQDYDTLKGLR